MASKKKNVAVPVASEYKPKGWDMFFMLFGFISSIVAGVAVAFFLLTTVIDAKVFLPRQIDAANQRIDYLQERLTQHIINDIKGN